VPVVAPTLPRAGGADRSGQATVLPATAHAAERDFLTKERRVATTFRPCLLCPRAALRAYDLVSLARPLMASCLRVRGDVNLAIPSNGQILYIEVIDGGHGSARHPSGDADNMHSTRSQGILAAYPEQESRVTLSASIASGDPATLVTVSA